MPGCLIRSQQNFRTSGCSIRPGDEKFQLASFLPPQHNNLSTTDKQSESEVWGFFNSPPRIFFRSSLPLTAARCGNAFLGREISREISRGLDLALISLPRLPWMDGFRRRALEAVASADSRPTTIEDSR